MTKISALFIILLLSWTYAFSFDLTELTLTKNITESTLPNGLKVIVKEEKSIPIVGFSITYKVGFRNEDTNGRTGLTHLLEHMQFKGTGSIKKGEIAKTLSDAGARFNAFTGYDKTCYWEIMPSGAFETALKIESDRMENSLIDPKEFESEKNVVLSELAHYESNPGTKLDRKLAETVYGSHPYAYLYGRLEDMKKADRDYVYKELYKKYYCPNNAYIVVVGNIDKTKALELVKKYFGKIPSNPSLPVEKANPLPFHSGAVVRTEGVASENFGNILFNLPGWNLKNHDFITLFFISRAGLLGGFDYDSSIDGGIGSFRFSEEPDYPAESIDRDYIEKNLTRIKEKLFHQETLDYDSVESIMMNLVYLARYTTYRSYDILAKEMDKLSAKDILAVIQKYFNKDNSSSGYFKATRQDNRAEPQSVSQTSESFGKDIDFSDLENPTPEAVQKTKAIGETVFRDALRSVSAYLSDVKEIKLDNGLTIICKPYALNQKVAINIGIKAGKLYQTSPAQAETAWDFVFEGGPQIKLRNKLENKGASFGGGADLNYSSYEMTTSAGDFNDAIDILAQSLTNRSFMPLVLEENKYNQILSLEEFGKSPNAGSHAGFELRKMLLGDRGAGLDFFAGNNEILKENISNINDFYTSFYRPENTVIVVVGNISYDKSLQKIRNSLGNWKQKAAVMKPSVPPLEKPLKDETFMTKLPVMQSIVLMAAPSSSYADISNYIALSLANQIFGGGGLTSRLARTIRDKYGLTYGVFTSLMPYADDSVFTFYMQNAKQDIPKAMALYQEELKRYKEEGPNDLEIAKFKNSLLSSVIFRYENSTAIADELLYFKMRRNDPKGDEQFIRILYSLDKAAINKAIRLGFPEYYFISIAGE